ncbi:DUF3558 domain-containing protein [Umezawaea sp. Da 62-37]|uniref:DUF3558 domain-containing protein n=1 Tax=Umezawaea sp. Da 62-37 TaxID=3075927 RepID=UPI0028F74501|nr:DUF3558 domain-containing protein [Umezawaea sp. Da 62-37]WNV89920.1 DUF3558 domain-containing protein [Umezawaea sp. Da 62-37]
MRTNGLILLMAVSACLLGACSEKDPGTPSAEPDVSTGTATGTTSSAPSTDTGAPELSLNAFADKPCDLLKSDEIAQLGTFKAPVKSSNEATTQCRWAAQDVTKGVAYTVAVTTNGVAFETAAQQAKSNNPYFETTEVSEYPAFNTDGTDAKGSCSTGVGTPSKGVFLVQINMENKALPEYNAPCAATEKAAALVVKNLKG